MARGRNTENRISYKNADGVVTRIRMSVAISNLVDKGWTIADFSEYFHGPASEISALLVKHIGERCLDQLRLNEERAKAEAEFHSKIEDLARNVESSERELAETEQDVAAVGEKMTASTERILKLKGKLIELKDSLKKTIAEMEVEKNVYEGLNKEFREKNNLVKQKREKVQESQRQLEQYTRVVVFLTDEGCFSEGKYAPTDAEVDELRRKLQDDQRYDNYTGKSLKQLSILLVGIRKIIDDKRLFEYNWNRIPEEIRKPLIEVVANMTV